MLEQFESRLLVNIANEAGQTVSDNDLVTTNTRIIGKLRAAGLRMPVIIDLPATGTNVSSSCHPPSILAATATRSSPGTSTIRAPSQPARIDSALATAKAQKIPFLMGEFANLSPGACGQSVPYLDVITKAQAAGVGYIPWSWDNSNSDCNAGSGSPFNMVSDGLHFSTLTAGWATEVVMSNAASIKNTSKRTYYQTNGKCKGAPVTPHSAQVVGLLSSDDLVEPRVFGRQRDGVGVAQPERQPGQRRQRRAELGHDDLRAVDGKMLEVARRARLRRRHLQTGPAIARHRLVVR